MVKKKATKKKSVKKTVKKSTSKKKEVVKKKNKTTKEEVSKENTEKKEFDIKVPLLVFLLLVLGVVFYFNLINSGYLYEINRGGVTYYSNTLTPSESFNQLRNASEVYVSPVLEENNASVFFTNAMNLWQVVLIGNNVPAVQLIRVKTNNEIVYCYTNFGSVQDSNQLTLEECNQILGDEDNFVVFINEGNKKVILDNNRINVYSSQRDAGIQNFNILKEVFPNAQNILDAVNQRIYGIL